MLQIATQICQLNVFGPVFKATLAVPGPFAVALFGIDFSKATLEQPDLLRYQTQFSGWFLRSTPAQQGPSAQTLLMVATVEL